MSRTLGRGAIVTQILWRGVGSRVAVRKSDDFRSSSGESAFFVVEDCQDVMAIENTGQYTGVYHVLNGLIHPMQGMGPSDLNIDNLVTRMQDGAVREVIFALPSTMEGDMTSFYISKRIRDLGAKVSSIARGIPVGSDLEFTDEITLARSLLNRTEFSVSQGDNGL